MKSQSSAGWLLGLVLSVLLSMVLGLTLVWLSIERTDIAYSLRKLKGQVDDALAHRAKLEVERDHLLSPGELRNTAQKLHMQEARPGQIRKLRP